MDAYSANGLHLQFDSAWFRFETGGQETRINCWETTFGDDFVGIGANSQDLGATESWFGKTQTWTAAKVVMRLSKMHSSFANDGRADFYIYNHNTELDLMWSISSGSITEFTVHEWALDVADWGTNFVNIGNAQIRVKITDLGVDPVSGAVIDWTECYIEGTYSGSATLSAREAVQPSITDHDGAWGTFTDSRLGGWVNPFNTSYILTGSGTPTADPSVDVPVIDTPGAWTAHNNGETPTAANFIFEHNVSVGFDNDNCQYDLVSGATPTQEEILWTAADGTGDFTETSANITTATDWDNCSVRFRFLNTVQMPDSFSLLMFRIMAEIDFPGLLGDAHDITASPEGNLEDTTIFMAGELLICGNPNLDSEMEALGQIAAVVDHQITATVMGKLDGLPYLHGTFEITAVPAGQLDATLGGRLDSSTIPDTVVVQYRVRLRDPDAVSPDVLIPMSKLSAVLRNGDATRATITVPAVIPYLDSFAEEEYTSIEVECSLLWDDGFTETIPRVLVVDLENVDVDRAAAKDELVVTGSKVRVFDAAKTWIAQREGNTVEEITSGSKTITTLHDPRVQPGDFIDILDVVEAEIKEVTIDVTPQQRLMTLST